MLESRGSSSRPASKLPVGDPVRLVAVGATRQGRAEVAETEMGAGGELPPASVSFSGARVPKGLLISLEVPFVIAAEAESDE